MNLAGSREPLRIGWASRDVTPDRPVLLRGQFHVRVSNEVRDPLTVTALALDTGADHCIMVSMDRVTIPDELRDGVRARLRNMELSGLDPQKVFMSATHTHTAPHVLPPDNPSIAIPWEAAGAEVMPPAEYGQFLIEQTADCIAEAWNARRPGGVSWGRGYAVVGFNRRQVKRDGTAQMYGDTSTADFSHIEGYEDHGVELLFTHAPDGRLTGMVVNLACPSQVTESALFVSADFWHEARCEIRSRFGDDVFILPQCSAAGDQSPHPMLNKRAEMRMLRLKGLCEKDEEFRFAQRVEIGRRIAAAVEDVYPAAARDIRFSVPLGHVVRTLALPRRTISPEELREAREQIAICTRKLEALKDRPPTDRERSFYYGRRGWYARVIERWEKAKNQPTVPMELHVVRIGDVAFATNAFELYLDFGIRMKARSPAVQTFVVQLAGPGSYLPTARAVAGGSYGAVAPSNVVGPEAGDLLVEETLSCIGALFRQQQP